MTSTRSFGRIKPPAPDSVVIGIDTARMPGATVAAMNPAESECTILVFVSGSPGSMGVRATVPFTIRSGFGFASCVKNVESTEDFGHGCQRTRSGVTGRPGSILVLATSTPTEATGPGSALL